MEHEVFVPVAAERLREVLADPVRVARAVPGLQQDAGAEPVAGRLKVRVGGHTITYRGAVRVSGHEDGSYAVEGDATEARGTGSVKLALTLRVREAEGGATLRIEGTASADGRVTEFAAEAVGSAVARLLDRFGEQLGVVAGETAPEAEQEGAEAETLEPEPLAPGEFETRVTSDFETTPDADDAAAPEPGPTSVFDAEVPPSPDPVADETHDGGDAERAEGDKGDEGAADAGGGEPPVAEAAHARRTMIGRSAEEVDHAPPRGRYAPVPAPQTVMPSSTLRWAAPAAALVLASAIVVGRMLRRRR
ncbi:carbon monoxide dehydrogenase [Streptomyces sp. ISL-22]|uniref:SRPBCC family protein n=1 Tax=unclassified Streptomyces TaxID=2593676 RepID=UPI001BE93FC4|nr:MULTISPECIES: SRPBCC family protein [unclassified Streptomyces]MBT2416942.1 carbon monoxide dehydrogenase [Streptomyces sp. ISL-24]MBT2436918.1 carbon monoxide dehydrogenase [Streptomyces sp. ISL-22]